MFNYMQFFKETHSPMELITDPWNQSPTAVISVISTNNFKNLLDLH